MECILRKLETSLLSSSELHEELFKSCIGRACTKWVTTVGRPILCRYQVLDALIDIGLDKQWISRCLVSDASEEAFYTLSRKGEGILAGRLERRESLIKKLREFGGKE